MGFFGLFSSPTSYKEVAAGINALEKELSALSDVQLKERAVALRATIVDKKQTLDEARDEAFALVREAAKRTLNQRHYDVQLMGGAALFDGKIVEMKTGEGKTLAATSPVFLHALSGKGVHVITVNDYLAQRDAVWMGQIYDMLGESVACIVHEQAFIYDPEWRIAPDQAEEEDKERDEMGSFRIQKDYLRPVSRKEAYACDIVYGTNNEFGFDYLRDNLAHSTDKQVQRGHYFAIIDEVDSVLIDEARTPMIISAPDRQAAQYYQLLARIVRPLQPEVDYEVDEKNHVVQITDEGIEKVEKALGVDNLYGSQTMQLVHYLEESLKAKALFSRDKQYVVKDGQIIIVDEFTGRMMYGRRYSGGLHQAIEAKEGVHVQEEAKTFAQITIQNYFRLYERISGMTGTAKTSDEEFAKVYGMEVIQIPTNRPTIRKDEPDYIFKHQNAKYSAVVKEIKERSEKGQPVLVGTTSIEENEMLSRMFSNAGIRHETLNAKNHEREGEIIAQAGKRGSVTLATNMAGRGVDIILGGNPPNKEEAEKIKELGGLFVLGTQRNDARRIDNQLRGRSGRQGDPGESRFFLSLEDDLMRVFGGDRIKSIMTRLHLPENEPIESKMVVKVVNEAQKKVEGLNFDVRKHLLEYDDVLDKQRKAVYRRRQNMLERVESGEGEQLLKETVLSSLKRHYNAYKHANPELAPPKDERWKDFSDWITQTGLATSKQMAQLKDSDFEQLSEDKMPEVIENVVKETATQDNTITTLISSIDVFWVNHLENLDALREAVRMRAYGQKDPLVEYKRESYQMFKEVVANAEEWAVTTIFQSQSQATSKTTPITIKASGLDKKFDKVGRNDPCPCGSGKKYKKCHGR